MYHGDIFLVVNNIERIHKTKSKIQENSVLQFIHELERAASLAFLDPVGTILQDRLHNAMFTIETNTGYCINFKSACPERHMTGVKYNFVTVDITSRRIGKRIEQIVTINNFTMKLVGSIIAIFSTRNFSLQMVHQKTNDKLSLSEPNVFYW